MRWLKYTLKTTTAAVDAVSEMLSEFGIDSIEVEDNVPLTEEEKKQMFVDILPPSKPDDGTSMVTFYIEEASEDDENASALHNSGTGINGDYLSETREGAAETIEKIKNRLSELREFVDIGEGTITAGFTDDAEWKDKWKEFFHSFRVGHNIMIVPTWEEPKGVSDDDIVIRIDPGIAFGTGAHETTRLCMEALQKYIKPGVKVLDVGCGSGILSIASLKLGAAGSVAIDIDPVAVRAAKDNFLENDVELSKVRLISGDLITDNKLRRDICSDCYDIVVANILAPVLVPLSPVIYPALKDGGVYICSGISEELADSVKKAIHDAGMWLIGEKEENGWVCLVAKKENS